MSDTCRLPLTGNPADQNERGELIGIGGQYTVHDIGDGRVVKIPNSMDGTRLFVGGWGPHIAEMKNKHKPMTETAYFRRYCVPHVLRLATRYPALYQALARPRAMPGSCFSQDRTRPLRDVMPEATPAEVRRYLDATADVCQLLWRYGIHDYVLYFLVNNALDAHGNVVCLDFGETAFDTTWVEAHVKQRDWETREGLVRNLAPEHKEYYFQVMKSRLSVQSFEQHWAADLDDLDRRIIEKPALAERPEEIPSLVEQILERASRGEGWRVTSVSPEAMEVLGNHTWYGSDDGVTPDLADKLQGGGWTGGGVEFQNVLYLAAEACRGAIIEPDDLPRYLRAEEPAKTTRT